MLAAALEAEVDAYLAEFVDERDEDGHRLVTRNGHARQRKVQTVAGAVEITAPRVNDRRVDEETGEKAGERPMVLDPNLLHSGQLVVELVVNPLVTPFLEAAAARGARTMGGLGMLVHQAALAIERWTGEEAPLGAMWKAAGARS